MTFSVGLFRAALLLLAGCALSGCLDSTQSQLDEQKESHFLMGKSRVSAMDYPGAIESFEKALEVNPKSSAAHFELACLYENRQMDPAAAIYHYQQYLRCRPNPDNTEIVNQHILALKQELVKSVSLGPVTERQQRDMERLVEDNKRLTDELGKCRAYALRLQSMTNTGAAAPTARPSPSVSSNQSTNGSGFGSNSVTTTRLPAVPSAAANPRTHTVQAGETPTTIARKYRVKLDALMAANPRLDPRRMRVGQTVLIPSASF